MPREPIVVAGAGIVGASIAYHLAKRGAQVLVLEASRPCAGATGKSFGWLNATFSKRPREYFDFNVLAMDDWHRLQQELYGEPAIEWGGSVAWCADEAGADEMRRGIANQRAWGYPVREIDAGELRALLPNVAPGEVVSACYCSSEGMLAPPDAVRAILQAAEKSGAEIRIGCAIRELRCENGEVRKVLTTGGEANPHVLVLACGTAIPNLAAMADVKAPMKDSVGVLVYSTPLPRLIEGVVLAPGVHFKQDPDGRFVIGGSLVAGAGTAATDDSIEQAGEIIERARRYVPGLNEARIDEVTLGNRVMPLDEYPIAGFTRQCSNLYLAATHSGVTLAPLIGRLAAEEILDGARCTILGPYTPARFT